MRASLSLLLFAWPLAWMPAQASSPGGGVPVVRVNQVGYFPGQPKVFTVAGAPREADFTLIDSLGTVAFSGTLGPPLDWTALAGERVRTGDFTAFAKTGRYALHVEGVDSVTDVHIAADPYAAALAAAVKSFYYQRAGTPVDSVHGGAYARSAGHPDDAVRYHPSSGRSGVTASPGGWYDAGDYGKYVVNGAFSTGIMLQLAAQYPGLLEDGALDIPESGNGIADLLDELRVELDWLLTMQDPADGGVHHKLTTEDFEGMVMPAEAVRQRYLMAKGTAATLDFVGSTALASRVYRSVAPGFADTLLSAAQAAYTWAAVNPDSAFRNPPGVRTGEYGDDDFSQESAWANAELWLASGEQRYADALTANPVRVRFEPGGTWNAQMTNLAVYSLLLEGGAAAGADAAVDLVGLRDTLLAVADWVLGLMDTVAYHQPVRTFHWGSTSDVLGAGMILANAYRSSGERRYLDGVARLADWTFGNNATGYCFLTGFGARSPRHIHHRPSAADGVASPVPGLLAGGPNPRQQDLGDGAVYPSGAAPMQSYVDQEASYASNEVCLNWNAPLVYVLGFLEANSRTLRLPADDNRE